MSDAIERAASVSSSHMEPDVEQADSLAPPAQPQHSERATKDLPDSDDHWTMDGADAFYSIIVNRTFAGLRFAGWIGPHREVGQVDDLPRGNWLKAHPAAEIDRLRAQVARLDTIRKTLPESWYPGLELERRVGYLVKQWRKLYEVVEELKQCVAAAEARVAEDRKALQAALGAIDEAYLATGHIKVAKTSVQRMAIESAIAEPPTTGATT